MTCREWEEAIALLVDGEPAATGLAEHLVDCGACRQLMQDLRADQMALRVIPAVDPTACEALRNDVMRRVGRRSHSVGQWFAAAGAIAAGLAIVSISVRMPGPTKLTVEINGDAPRLATGDKNVGTKADVAGLKARSTGLPKKRLRGVAAVELAMDSEWGRILSASPAIDERPARRGSTSEVAMRIQTSDPDVVILWLKEEVKGGSNE
jgi:hypothetical protein